MRILFSSTSHCAQLAKTLKRELASTLPNVRLSDAQKAVGRVMGFRDWHELERNCLPGATPTPTDDAVDDKTRAERREFQVAALAESTGIDRREAERIVDLVRPTGRRLGVVEPGKEPWRRRLEETAAKGGCVGLHQELVEEFFSRDHGFDHWERLADEPLGEFGTLLLRANRHKVDRVQGTAFNVVEYKIGLSRKDKIVARARGYLVTTSGVGGKAVRSDAAIEAEIPGMTDLPYRFFDACDQIEDDVTEAATALNNAGLTGKVFAKGDLAVLVSLGRDFTSTVKGDGARLLAEWLKAANRISKKARVRSLAFESLLPQFGDIDYNQRKATPMYRQAQEHFATWLKNSAAIREALGGDDSLVFSYDTGPEMGVADGGVMASLEAIGGVEREFNTPWERTLCNTSLAISRFGGQLTKSLKSEPKALAPDEFPDGFDLAEASIFKSVRPHKDIWRHMPSDLTSVTVEPQDGDERSKHGMRPRFRLTFRFANGTELVLGSEKLVYGLGFHDVAPELKTQADTLVLTNPFTNKMSSLDLQYVLAVNAAMLFDGNVGSAPERMDKPVVVRRPEHTPRAVAHG